MKARDAAHRVMARYSDAQVKTAAFPPFSKNGPPPSPDDVSGPIDGSTGSVSGARRNIPANHQFDPRALKPMSKALFATSVGLGHALTAYRHLSRLKSTTVSPDGMLGGRGYIMAVKEARQKLFEACESLSAIADTLYDEIQAPHWKPKLGLLDPNEAEDVSRLIEEAQGILADPEDQAEAGIEEIEQENDLPTGDDAQVVDEDVDVDPEQVDPAHDEVPGDPAEEEWDAEGEDPEQDPEAELAPEEGEEEPELAPEEGEEEPLLDGEEEPELAPEEEPELDEADPEVESEDPELAPEEGEEPAPEEESEDPELAPEESEDEPELAPEEGDEEPELAPEEEESDDEDLEDEDSDEDDDSEEDEGTDEVESLDDPEIPTEEEAQADERFYEPKPAPPQFDEEGNPLDPEDAEGDPEDAEGDPEDAEGDPEEDEDEDEPGKAPAKLKGLKKGPKKKPKKKAKKPGGDEETSSQMPGGGPGEESQAKPIAPSLKQAAKVVRRMVRKANSSVPVETLSGPRVDHLGPGEGEGPHGSWNPMDDATNDPWGNESWSHDLEVEATSGMPSDPGTETEARSWGLGDGDGGAIEERGEPELHSLLPGQTVDVFQRAAVLNSLLPGDSQEPVARSDYYPGPKGHQVQACGCDSTAQSKLPGEATAPVENDPSMMNTDQVVEDVTTPYVHYSDLVDEDVSTSYSYSR